MVRAAFHVCRILPQGRPFHGLTGYREQAEALVWALRALGYEATEATNAPRPDAINLVMGVQMLSVEQLDELPPRTVIYNLEQMARHPLEGIRPVMRAAARRFPVWDFSAANLEVWKQLGADDAQHVMIGWAPVLERIAPVPVQDIEALIYGSPSDERLDAFRALCAAGVRSVFVYGLYGGERDALIARSKLIVNASANPGRIFEISRISYLLANAKAVVSVSHAQTLLEPDMRDAVLFSPPERLVVECLALLDDDARRRALQARGQSIFRARDMRAILRPAVAKLLRP